MFERFTERARWAMHWARSEASRLGSPRLSSEHLLLGVLHEEKSFFYAETAEDLIGKIEKALPRGGAIPAGADMPLSDEAKLILSTTAQGADGLAHGSIDVLHLLWALVKHKETHAGRLLAEAGITLDQVEAEMKERRYH
ncbi:MAG: hypothetical protein IT165_36540 [Bryobacterales bacterium]|nr:hypothetical protein [Bryobacterales bacterium]